MTDRELLELAAKAAGYGDVWSLHEYPEVTYIGPRYKGGTVRYRVWNPLTDDGDAMRLAVKLKIPIQFPDWANVTRTCGDEDNFESFYEDHGIDPYAATRRAIVRAAAEIGKEET
jgi:hypothetical protein